MTKPEISFTQDPLKYVCNELFYGAKRFLGEAAYASDIHDKKLAFSFGAVGAVGLAELGKHIAYPEIIQPLTESIGTSVSLEEVISHSLAFTIGAIATPILIAPKKIKEFIKEHTTYASGIAGVFIKRNSQGKIIGQPIGIFVTQNKQYRIPLRYMFETEFIDFGKGLDAGIYLMPRVVSTKGGLKIDGNGALLYLSRKTVHSQLAKLYLYEKETPYFKQVHSEDDLIVSQIKSQNPDFNFDIIYSGIPGYRGLKGPIRIWEISYPEDVKFNEDYLSRVYPTEIKYAT